ncbi:hypothetical protein M231_07728 [Tremella mesenterica]|uniref:Enoyl reductase (ER) domain-containing protein n=1 Tax=Tremella mesenterica TaxID=5217 RepID=A0A4Q1BDR0_TREME|nr:hypothetical protein M231_07728 [Tremella mesenterica]
MVQNLFQVRSDDMLFPKSNTAWLLEQAAIMKPYPVDIPQECGPWEAIVCPKRNGICGSDMHIYLTAKCSRGPVNIPFILGHECAGIVCAVGENVKNVKPGDRVALEPGEACLRCVDCKAGHYNQCEFMRFASDGFNDGTLQGFYRLPADLCHKLPDNMTLEEGALMEPLSVAVHAVNEIAKMRPGKNVIVFGAGPIGLVSVALGAKRIIAVNTAQDRLDFAKKYAATDIHAAAPMEPGETRAEYSIRHAEIIREKFGLSARGSTGIDYVFECSGAEVCIQTGLRLLKHRGSFVQVGFSRSDMSVPWNLINVRELNVTGTFRYGAGVYEMAIDLVSRGLVDVKPLLTHRYPFSQTLEAFATSKNGKGPDGEVAIKVMIDGPDV